MLGRSLLHLNSGADQGSEIRPPFLSLVHNLPNQAPDSLGEGAFKPPRWRGCGSDFKARSVDHQPNAPKLTMGLGPPTEEAEMNTARSSDPESSHERAEVESR